MIPGKMVKGILLSLGFPSSFDGLKVKIIPPSCIFNPPTSALFALNLAVTIPHLFHTYEATQKFV
jgi:hypothetical protein